jgi:DNA primase catalytic subunit
MGDPNNLDEEFAKCLPPQNNPVVTTTLSTTTTISPPSKVDKNIQSNKSSNIIIVDDQKLLKTYLAKRYPTSDLWRMLSGANRTHREFGMFYMIEKTEIMQRYVSFETDIEFSNFLAQKHPFRMEVGPVYTIIPKMHELVPTSYLDVAYREYTIDLDSDEYDKKPARTCCKGRDVCEACWPIIMIGCCMVDEILSQMGAISRGWFFSGGRGMHCWITDREFCLGGLIRRREILHRLYPQDIVSYRERATIANDPTARAVTSLLFPSGFLEGLPSQNELFGDGDKDDSVNSMSSSHVYCHCGNTKTETDICDKNEGGDEGDDEEGKSKCPFHCEFGAFIGWYAKRHPSTALLSIKERIEWDGQRALSKYAAPILRKIIAAIQQKNALEIVANALNEERTKKPNITVNNLIHISDSEQVRESAEIIVEILNTIAGHLKMINLEEKDRDSCYMRDILIEAALSCLSPRLDKNVSEQPKHCLKAPMSVHPLTKRLAMYVDRKEFMTFEPKKAPMLIGISKNTGLAEFDDEEKATNAFCQFSNWTKTVCV